jgi:predicted amidohydrolase
MKKKLFPFILLLLANLAIAQGAADLPKVKFVDYKPEDRQWFVRFGQFQLNFEYDINPANGLVVVKNPKAHVEKVSKCLEIAKKNEINVIVFPEVSMSLPTELFQSLLSKMETFSKENDVIIIAGTFYDEERNCKNVTILPTGAFYSYKLRPSIFEASPLANKGMLFNDTLHVFRTKYGNLLTLVCVDLISDDANYMARNLSNRGLIDMLININFNPKSQEFMREASAMTVRHPLFVSLTNVSLF